MYNSIILDYILNGEIERRISKDTPKLNKIMGNVSDYYDELIAALDENQKQLLDKFRNELDEYSAEESYSYFEQGFKAGFNIAIAAKE
jgi:hypothetical protein